MERRDKRFEVVKTEREKKRKEKINSLYGSRKGGGSEVYV